MAVFLTVLLKIKFLISPFDKGYSQFINGRYPTKIKTHSLLAVGFFLGLIY